MIFNKRNTIERFRNGDHKAFRALYDTHFDSLYLFGLKYIPSQDVVEDIVQDSFIKVWERRDDFFDEPSFKSFLYKSIRNSCLNYFEHKKVKDKFINYQKIIFGGESFFNDSIIEEELNQIIANTLNELPDASRDIYMLYLNGLKNQEIADDLGISVNTVKTQKQRANKFLRHRLIEIVSILTCILQ